MLSIFLSIAGINQVLSFQIFPNIGLVLEPNNFIYQYSYFGHVENTLVVNFTAIGQFHETFIKECALHGLSNRTTSPFNYRHLSTMQFYNSVEKKIKEFSKDLDFKSIVRYNGSVRINSGKRKKRQAMALGALIGVSGNYLLNKLFNLGSNYEIRDLKANFQEVQNLRTHQVEEIENQLEILRCSEDTNEILKYRTKSQEIISKELAVLDNLLLSLNYRLGLSPRIFHVFLNACY